MQSDAQKYNEFVNNGTTQVYDNQPTDLDYNAPVLETGFLHDGAENKEFVDSEYESKSINNKQVSRNNTVMSSKKSLDKSVNNGASKYGIKFFSVRDQKSRNDLKEEDESEF